MSFDTEHWSSPNGCHPDCPACAEEAYPQEDWEYEVANGDTKLGYEEWRQHRIESEEGSEDRLKIAAPAMLAALMAIVDSEDTTLGDGGSILGAGLRELAIEAIALTEPPKEK